jgi:hypothetical protein
MKNKLLFTVALLGLMELSFEANAQLLFGIKAGINSSAQAEFGNLYDGDSYKPGLVVGARAGFSFTKVISVSTEIIYQNKGSRCNYDLTGKQVDLIRDFHYLNIPLLINAGFSKQIGLEPSWEMYGCFGPYFGKLLDAKDYSSNKEISEQPKLIDQAKDTDYGLVFGIGASHKVKSFDVYTEIRYDMGLSEIMKTDNQLRNKIIALTIGVNL